MFIVLKRTSAMSEALDISFPFNPHNHLGKKKLYSFYTIKEEIDSGKCHNRLVKEVE